MYDELKNNISRIGNFAEGDYINAITYFLKSSKKSSSNSQKKQLLFKKDEVKLLIEYAKNKNIFFTKIENCNYISGGAEQKVYLLNDGLHVLKTNDAIFYESWEDYFINLHIHNTLFPTTKYEFIGIFQENEKIFSIVKQRFIISTEATNLYNVRKLLENNGFIQ